MTGMKTTLDKIRIMFCAVVLLCVYTNPVMAQFNAFEESSKANNSNNGAVPNLTPVEEKVDAGKVDIGSTSQVIVMFRNEGVRPVRVGQIDLYPSTNVTAKVALDKCTSAPVAPGADCAMTLSLTGLQKGGFRVEMLIEHDGVKRYTRATLTGTIEDTGDSAGGLQSEIEAVPSSVDFGNLTGRTPLIRSVTLRNKTSETITIDDLTINAAGQAGFTMEHDCEVLKPAEGCIISVTWKPAFKGPAWGVLVVKHSGSSHIAQVELKGDYQPASVSSVTSYPEAVPGQGLLVANTEAIDFGTEADSRLYFPVTLVNEGDVDVMIDSIRLGGSGNGLFLSRSGCRAGTILSPVEACVLTVHWTPNREGSILDAVQIFHTGTRGLLILPVTGEADEAVRQDTSSVLKRDGVLEDGDSGSARLLDGYIVTSLSKKKAVITGPVGSHIVKDGEIAVLSNTKWLVTIDDVGVALSSENDELYLVFDKSLSPVGREGDADSDDDDDDDDDDDNDDDDDDDDE